MVEKKLVHTHKKLFGRSKTDLLNLVQRYSAFLILSVVIALVGLALQKTCHHASHQFISFILQTGSVKSNMARQHWYLNRPYLPLFVIPLGFAVIYYITDRYFFGADRGGIPQTKYALSNIQEKMADRILSLRTVVGKFALTTASFFCGASLGLEGPMIFISTAITYTLSKTKIQLFREKATQRLLIVTGGAVGIAVAFNTPLSAIAFVIEEHHHTLTRKLGYILIPPIIISTIVCDFFIERTQYFSATTSGFQLNDWVILPFIAIIGGLLGGLFSRLLFHGIHYCSHLKKRKQRILFAAFCGLCVAGIGFLSSGNTYGTGFFEADKLIVGQGYLAPSFSLLKALSTLLSYISGIPGGILSPSLTIGAGFGNQVSLLFPHAKHNIVVILSMLSYFTGVLQNPMTCLLIILEMTGRNDLLVPMMASSWIAKFASTLIFKDPIYQSLAKLCHLRYRA